MPEIAQEEDPATSSRLVAGCFDYRVCHNTVQEGKYVYSKYGIACQDDCRDKHCIAVASRVQYNHLHQQQVDSNTVAITLTVNGNESETHHCERQNRIQQETASCTASILLVGARSTSAKQLQTVHATDSYCVICRFHEPEVHVWDRLWGCEPRQERDMRATSDMVTGRICAANHTPVVLQENNRFNPTVLVLQHCSYECRMLQNSNYMQKQLQQHGYNLGTSELVPGYQF